MRVLPNLPSPGRLLLGPGNSFSTSFLSVSLQHSARLARARGRGRAVLVGLQLVPGALGREQGGKCLILGMEKDVEGASRMGSCRAGSRAVLQGRRGPSRVSGIKSKIGREEQEQATVAAYL